MELSGLFRGDKKAAHHLSRMCWTFFAALQTLKVISHTENSKCAGLLVARVGGARHSQCQEVWDFSVSGLSPLLLLALNTQLLRLFP